MKKVFPKKWLGQHFLNDDNIAFEITNFLSPTSVNVLEIGPGMGILTKHLLEKELNLKLIEIDKESVAYLKSEFDKIQDNIIEGDFLKYDLSTIFNGSFSIIGNFPYNISSQILFKSLENKQFVTEIVGMFQKEVAERICSKKGNRTYGILSVLIQAFFDVEYLKTIEPDVFTPPPKVKSAVIRLTRKECYQLNCDEKDYFRIVKKAFNQRRKKLRNALSEFQFTHDVPPDIFHKRAETLGVEDYVMLANCLIKTN